ncbi:deoxynucleoside kinase [Nostoc sp. 106C]|uniref:deoxynucleoside kinase n=1 Tax=Nostoc sp. 106C TaxID=1932667 RepID=UPI000A397B23|nr:deoxynucleoside kinase [Nostoc sp. 106C]OUL28511.1 hypothetical protein BV375_17565 [Nostoc sp. 106C]
MKQQRNLFITISGNIGSGKTTLCQKLHEEYGCNLLNEEIINYLYIEDFYADMKRWSFHNQIQFIIHKFQQQASMKNISNLVCQDISAYECYEIFSRKLFEDNLINYRDFQCLTDLYNLLTATLPLPDLVIHLRTSIEILQERIINRGRQFERNITLSYLNDLESRYATWIQTITFCPVITIDTGSIDTISASKKIYQAAIDLL